MSKIIEYCQNLNRTLEKVENIIEAIKKEKAPVNNSLKDQLITLSTDLNSIRNLIQQKLEANERLKAEHKAA